MMGYALDDRNVVADKQKGQTAIRRMEFFNTIRRIQPSAALDPKVRYSLGSQP
jgi:hypothetical protein